MNRVEERNDVAVATHFLHSNKSLKSCCYGIQTLKGSESFDLYKFYDILLRGFLEFL